MRPAWGGIAGERDRFDIRNRVCFAPEAERAIIENLKQALPDVDAVIIADQADEDDCGVITHTLRDALIELAEQYPQVVFWVDRPDRGRGQLDRRSGSRAGKLRYEC